MNLCSKSERQYADELERLFKSRTVLPPDKSGKPERQSKGMLLAISYEVEALKTRGKVSNETKVVSPIPDFFSPATLAHHHQNRTRERVTMRAERDDFRPVRRTAERRLAYEIALGIWLGGMALGLTSFALWFFALSAMVGALKFG
ncbi:hypothetical protein [Pseudomonas aeruginosa]|uniref:hypothetical protein n=2 Tax=Bacteria TaxID=2 RepID=UPI0021B341C8|nr:hypothetical protein [Pseudomonas aeruginosa]MCT7418379.1 hypothetical protein [Pseudomonas aeruginosa]